MASVSGRRAAILGGHLLGRSVIKAQCRSLSSDAEKLLMARYRKKVLDSHMSYLDTGIGEKAVIFLHGNPTCAYLWRNIIPHVQPIARCLAPDLIGMGMSGKEPNNSYRFVDHYKYLCAWIDSLNLPKKLSFVIHDWGSGLGFHWCNQHRDRVESIVFMEALVGPVPSWDGFPDAARNIFQALRSPAGEELVLEKNFFVERLLPGSIIRTLDKEEMDVYLKPYTEKGESRRPTLTWPREIPIATDGPEDVVRIAADYYQWLTEDASIPKLYVHGDPGFFSAGIKKAVQNWPNMKTVTVKGLHFLQEDSPDDIGRETRNFLQQLYAQ